MRFGLDRLGSANKLVDELKHARVGLVAHPASVDRELLHASDILIGLGIRPAIFFGPEHGYGGEAQDMVGVASAKDARTGAPIVSLYGDDFSDLSPAPAQLANVDVLVIDLADVGSRYYTFIWTALLVLRAAVKAGVRVVVLDRPNPIGCKRFEGRLPSAGFLSFVGLEPIPIRHALTLGEVVALFAKRDGVKLGDALRILPCDGIAEGVHATAWDRPFVMPSPNMPLYETALVYPGGCLIEGTNLSEGRGTTRPFEIVGAPWLDGRRLAGDLRATKLEGFLPRPITFQPTFQKFGKQNCGGVFIHVTDARSFRPVAVYTALVALAHAQDPEHFRFRTERYEFIDAIPAFDLLTGSDVARRAIEAGEDARAVAEELSNAGASWTERIEEARDAANAARIDA